MQLSTLKRAIYPYPNYAHKCAGLPPTLAAPQLQGFNRPLPPPLELL